MKNKIIILLIIISFIVGAVQLLANRTISTDANTGATQHTPSSSIDGITGATIISELDALSGASTLRDDEYEDEHEEDHEHEDEHDDDHDESEYDD